MADLSVDDAQLARLVADLDEMERYLKRKIAKMDGLLDTVGTRWRGPAAVAFKNLQKKLNEDARTIRTSLIVLEEAVKKSRDGFTAQERETLRRMRSLELNSNGDRLLAQADTDPGPQPPKPRSKFLDYM